MRKLIALISFLFLCGASFGQLSQFRMIGSGSWSTVNDSTFSSTVTIQSDLTSNGFLPTGITDSMKVFSQTGQRYRISSATNLTFSGADLIVVESGGDWGAPVGQVMIYEDKGRTAIPSIPFGATGATAKMQEAVVSYNSTINNLTPTGVIPGVYTNASITVDDVGRITSASSGAGSSVSEIDTVLWENGADTVNINLALNNVFRINMTASDAVTLNLSNPVNGQKYTFRWFGNSDNDTLYFPSNFYAVTQTEVGELQDFTANSGIIEVFYDTAYYSINCIPDCSIYTPPAPSVYETEYQAILDRWTGLGYTHPSDSVKTAQNILLRSLKDSMIWDSLELFYVLAHDGNGLLGTINWTTPDSVKSTAILVDSPTQITNQGLQGQSSTSSGFTTTWDATNDAEVLTLNDASYGIYSYTDTAYTSNIVEWGNGVSSNRMGSVTRQSPTRWIYAVNATTGPSVNDPDDNTVGFYHWQRITSSTSRMWKDGVLLSTDSNSSTSINSTDFTGIDADRTYAILFLGTALEDKEAAFYDIINTYLTTLNP